MFAIIGLIVDVLVFVGVFRLLSNILKRAKDKEKESETTALNSLQNYIPEIKKAANHTKRIEQVDPNLSPRLQQDLRQRHATVQQSRPKKIKVKEEPLQPLVEPEVENKDSMMLVVENQTDQTKSQAPKVGSDLISSVQDLRRAVILKEILDKPLALREEW